MVILPGVCLILALVFFLLAAVNVPSTVSFGWLGMVFVTLAALIAFRVHLGMPG